MELLLLDLLRQNAVDRLDSWMFLKKFTIKWRILPVDICFLQRQEPQAFETCLPIAKTAKTQMPNWKMTLFSNLRLPWSASEAQKRSLIQICIFFHLENTIICQIDFEICKNCHHTASSYVQFMWRECNSIECQCSEQVCIRFLKEKVLILNSPFSILEKCIYFS